MDEWTQELHHRQLAVSARSILGGGDAATRFGRGSEDAIRNSSSILERQVATDVQRLPPDNPTVGSVRVGAHAQRDSADQTDHDVC